MKIMTFTKKSLLLIFCCVFLGGAALTVAFSTTAKFVSASSEQRDIPIYSVETDEKKVAISFDAAWGNEQTQTLLDILKEKNATATFFLVGEWVEKYPESVKAIYDAGHDVENHSGTHAYMTQLSEGKMTEEIVSCNEKIKAITGECPSLFRPPYGDYNNSVVKAVKAENMYCIQWDVDSLDWKDLSADEITQRVTSKLQPGSIVLLHNGAKNTPEALPAIIEGIRAQGYELVPISELLPKGDYTTDHEGRMHLCE